MSRFVFAEPYEGRFTDVRVVRSLDYVTLWEEVDVLDGNIVAWDAQGNRYEFRRGSGPTSLGGRIIPVQVAQEEAPLVRQLLIDRLEDLRDTPSSVDPAALTLAELIDLAVDSGLGE